MGVSGGQEADSGTSYSHPKVQKSYPIPSAPPQVITLSCLHL